MTALLKTTVSINEWILILAIALFCILAFVIFDYFRATREYEREKEQLKDKADQAARERDDAVASAQAKDAAATGISKEILNPINAIRTVVGLVAEEDVTSEIKEYCDVLKISADSLAHTANEVLGYTAEDIDDNDLKNEDSEKKLIIPDARILIVDDNKVSSRVALALINTFKPETVVSDNAYEAIDLIRNGEKFDLIFMDHLMPGMDGVEATKHIHELEGDGSRTPVVAVTANTDGNLEQEFFNAGMCDFLAKPIVVKQLTAILKKWISKEKQIYVDAAEFAADKFMESYRPDRAMQDYWNDFDLFMNVLLLFKEEGDKLLEILSSGDLSSIGDDLTKFSRYTRSIRALKLENLTNELIDLLNSPDKPDYSGQLRDVTAEYHNVCATIDSFIKSRTAGKDREEVLAN